MSIWEIIAVGLGLSMDAAAVALCNSLGSSGNPGCQAPGPARFLRPFSGVMPVLGYFLGSLFPALFPLCRRHNPCDPRFYRRKHDPMRPRGSMRRAPGRADPWQPASPIRRHQRRRPCRRRQLFRDGVNVGLAAPIIALTTFCCRCLPCCWGKGWGTLWKERGNRRRRRADPDRRQVGARPIVPAFLGKPRA